MNSTAPPAPEHAMHAASAIRFQLFGNDFILWPGEVIGLIMLVGIVWAFWHAHTSPKNKNPLDLGEMFVWPGTHHTSVAMVLYFLTGMASLWVVIDQELKGKLTEGTLTIVIGAFVTGKVVTEGWNAWRSKTAPPPSMTTEHTERTTVVAPPAPVPPVVVPPPSPAKKGK